jgi:hypothetical protein
MNRDCENNQMSRLPIQMAGVAYARMANGIRLSIYAHMVIPIVK